MLNNKTVLIVSGTGSVGKISLNYLILRILIILKIVEKPCLLK